MVIPEIIQTWLISLNYAICGEAKPCFNGGTHTESCSCDCRRKEIFNNGTCACECPVGEKCGPKESLSAGAIVGIVIGTLVGLICCCFCGFKCFQGYKNERRKRNNAQKHIEPKNFALPTHL